MSRQKHVRSIALIAMVAGLGLLAGAEEWERAPRTFSGMLNVDALIDNYVRVLARKYDLTEDQDAFTEQFVRAKVDAFLDRHYDELSDLVDRLFDVRTGGEMTGAELMDWGRRVQPIYAEAKEIIVAANDEWREILSEEQRRVHDEDVKLMYQSFATTEDQLERIMTGAMTVEEFRNPRRPPAPPRRTVSGRDRTAPHLAGDVVRQQAEEAGITEEGAARPHQPSAVIEREVTPVAVRGGPSRHDEHHDEHKDLVGQSSRGSGKVEADKGLTGEWEEYVREFVERYRLNVEQRERAFKILKSCQQLGERHMRKHQAEIERLDRQLEQLKDSASETESKNTKQAELSKQRSRLLAPIKKIFEGHLKPRLEAIPTRAQRQAAAKSSKQKSVRRGPSGTSEKPADRQPQKPAQPPPGGPREENEPGESEKNGEG